MWFYIFLHTGVARECDIIAIEMPRKWKKYEFFSVSFTYFMLHNACTFKMVLLFFFFYQKLSPKNTFMSIFIWESISNKLITCYIFPGLQKEAAVLEKLRIFRKKNEHVITANVPECGTVVTQSSKAVKLFSSKTCKQPRWIKVWPSEYFLSATLSLFFS